MSTDPSRTDLERLRQLLHELDERRARGRPVTEDAAEKTARALLGQPGPDLDCETVQAELPAYVDAELRGARLDERGRRIAAHLRSCEECSYLYAHILEHEQSMGSGQEPGPEAPLPAPEMADLRLARSQALLQEFVVRTAHELLEVLAPAALPDLPYLAGPILESLRTLPAGTRPDPALGAVLGVAGKGEKQPFQVAACYLAATWFATERLQRSIDPERVAWRRSEGRFQFLAREAALQAASDVGLGPSEQARFAEEYARLIAQPEAQLPFVTGKS